MMFLNFRAPNSYKLHAYKNWIINTLIKNSESMFRLCIMKLFFFLLKFVVIWFYCFILFVIFLVWMVLNAFYQVIAPNWSQCVSQPTTRRGWICEDLRETDRRCIFYTMIHSFEAIREFMIKLENRPPQKKWIYTNLPRKDRFTQWCQIIWPRATLKLELTATTYYSIVFCIKHNICPPRAKLSNTDHYPL